MKIIARMRGGLGNQLFILAYACTLAEQYGPDTEIVLDTREYETFKIRNYELQDIIQNKQIRLLNEQDKTKYYDISRTFFHISQRLIRKETGSISFLSTFGLYYGRRNADYIKPKKTKTAYVYGYFQDARITHVLKNPGYLSFPDIAESQIDPGKPTIAVSIRCGQDYVDMGWPICGGEYYRKGIDRICERKYPDKKVNIIVFSDEIDQAKEMGLPEGAIYVEGMSPTEQLGMMKQCEDFVIANSSFSWWGAYLGAKEDSMVIMPELWYSGNVRTEETKLLYSNTVILKTEGDIR